ETPLMKQYHQIKSKHPGALLLFRVGDFYETFGEDAIKTSRILGIVLTKRKNGAAAEIELAGFPHHSLETYLPKLVRAGQRVAVCDQLEDPKMTKTIVKRGVTELVTPGVAFNDQVLTQKSNNYLAAVHFGKTEVGVAFLDVSTGDFFVGQGPSDRVEKLLSVFNPSEIIYQKQRLEAFKALARPTECDYRLEDWVFTEDFANDHLCTHFATKNLVGFGVQYIGLGVIAASAALHYVKENQLKTLHHIRSLSRIDETEHLWMDRFTIRNLELLYAQHEQGIPLLEVIDQTLTPMGGRLMKRWLVMPLTNLNAIQGRIATVDWFYQEMDRADEIRTLLNQCGDLERLVSKVAVGKVNPRELRHLHRTLSLIVPLQDALQAGVKNPQIAQLINSLRDCSALLDTIDRTLELEPALSVGKGGVIREGVDDALDELRRISHHGKAYLDALQEREAQATGISSLKIAYNNVFGYYIEVRNTHKDKVPEAWIRKQTLVNAERYITEELKTYEEKILGAESKILEIEQRLYSELVQSLISDVEEIQANALALARIDVFCGLAVLAKEHHYSKPEVNDSTVIHIEEGRHPVIERALKTGEIYVANDVFLSNEEQQILMITGPNMSGKSAVLRQTALIVLLAQIGSFVPAKKAVLGIVDKLFSRVGASDNLSAGESTFMVEMNETASILNNLSERSLVILDEIGRGTSTYDGISIAWSITEYLHENAKFRPKTLFATHYHELTQLAASLNRLRNWSVAVKEWQDEIVFIRRVVPGAADRSYGIQVARLAGMPPGVVSRAREILSGLETGGGLPNKQVVKTADVSELSVPVKVTKKESRPTETKTPPKKTNQGPELDLFG
ncbi:MAG: DNA mismatch repair protein MutS, partial [Flavobacteriia bacterium]|nr:DNA mismatch repair protein MutS [Flavobacteriia bacterium]